jgi:hypothetical protein
MNVVVCSIYCRIEQQEIVGIKELQNLYEETPTTDHLLRAEILNGIEHSKTDLSKIQAKYEIFKKYKMRTAISK